MPTRHARGGAANGNHRGWLIVGVAVLMQTVVSGVVVSSFSFWIPSWMSAFGTGRAVVTATLTAALFAAALIGPVGGHFMDRWSVRGVACLGLIIFAAGAALISLANGFWQVQLLYGIAFGMGLAFAGVPAAQTMTAKAFERGQGLALSLVILGTPLGGVIMPKIIATLLTHYDWRAAARIVAIGTLMLIPIVAWSVRPNPKVHATRQDAGTLAPGLVSPDWNIRTILATPGFWLLLIVFFPEYAAMMGYIANVAQFSEGWGLSPTQAASYLSLAGLAAIGAIVVVGRLSGRGDPRYVLFTGYIIAGCGFLLAIGAASTVQIGAACVLIGAGTAVFYPLQGILVARQFGAESFGRAIGLLNFFLLAGGLAGPLGGAMRDRLGNYNSFFILCALVPILCSTALLFLRPQPVAGAL
jgi:MFS family permease